MIRSLKGTEIRRYGGKVKTLKKVMKPAEKNKVEGGEKTLTTRGSRSGENLEIVKT